MMRDVWSSGVPSIPKLNRFSAVRDQLLLRGRRLLRFRLLVFSAERDGRFRLEFPVIGELHLVPGLLLIGG
jgi:hypothetical protein